MANFVAILLCVLAVLQTSDGFLQGLAESFDFSRMQGPVPTDKDVWRNVSQLIKSNGYPCEEHFAVTHDGFILNIQRIPHGKKHNLTRTKPKPVVFLQHGLLADSACWVFNLPNDSLAYILADNGFDVWLGNSRGNRYARRNKHLSPDCPKFWKWSFQDLAKYDLPATIDYILDATGQEQLVYVGHSQGTLIAFAAFSTNPELEKKIKLFIALAPIVTIGNIRVKLIRLAAEITTGIEAVAPLIDSPFFPGDIWRTQFVEKGFCNGYMEETACYEIGKILFGDDEKDVNKSRIPVYLSNFPSGTSLRDMVHLAQLLVSKRCQKFNYGIIENFIHYGQAEPPEYKIEKIRVRIAIFSGGHDTLSNLDDVALLIRRIKNLVFYNRLDDYNHVDFVTGIDAKTVLYPDVVSLAQRYSAQSAGYH